MQYTLIRNFTCAIFLLASSSCLLAQDINLLFGKSWALISLNERTIEKSLYPQKKPSISLGAGGRFHAFAGCNQIAGSYTLTPPDKLKFGTAIMTKMACMTEGNIEDEFVAMLDEVNHWQLKDHQLIFLDTNHKVLAVFN